MDSGNQEDNGIGTADLCSSLNRLYSPQGTSTKEKAAGGDYSQLKQVSSLFVLSVSQVYIIYSPIVNAKLMKFDMLYVIVMRRQFDCFPQSYNHYLTMNRILTCHV